MKRTLLIATAVAGLAFSGSAFAQVTGTVGITGSVAAKCTVIGGASTSAFGATIALGELSQTDGTLRSDLQGSTPVTGATKQFTVNCNGTDADISLTADEFDAGLGAPANGFSSTLDYTAEFDGALAGGGSKVVTNLSSTAAATTDTLGGALANAANNITIKAYSFTTKGGNSDLLRASNNYVGTIHVTITPTT